MPILDPLPKEVIEKDILSLLGTSTLFRLRGISTSYKKFIDDEAGEVFWRTHIKNKYGLILPSDNPSIDYKEIAKACSLMKIGFKYDNRLYAEGAKIFEEYANAGHKWAYLPVTKFCLSRKLWRQASLCLKQSSLWLVEIYEKENNIEIAKAETYKKQLKVVTNMYIRNYEQPRLAEENGKVIEQNNKYYLDSDLRVANQKIVKALSSESLEKTVEELKRVFEDMQQLALQISRNCCHIL